MANANVLDGPKPQYPEQDDICRAYKDQLNELADLRRRHDAWQIVIDEIGEGRESEDDLAFIEKLQREIDDKKLSWEHIKTKDFPQSQAEVKAMSWMMRRLTDHGTDLEDRIRAKRRLILEYEINNALILIAGGYTIDKEQAQKEKAELAENFPTNEEDLSTNGENQPEESTNHDTNQNGALETEESDEENHYNEGAEPVVSRRGRKGKN